MSPIIDPRAEVNRAEELSLRVLVSPASKHGGTAEIGRRIARVLRDNGIDVDVTQPEDIHDVTPYAGYIIGSALYMGSWLPATQHFVDEHRDGLRLKPTWLFSSGPLGEAKPEEPIHPDVRDALMSASNACEHRLFSGRLELSRLGRRDRFVARWVGAKDGDYREWDDIDAWTRSIAEAFRASDVAAPGEAGDLPGGAGQPVWRDE